MASLAVPGPGPAGPLPPDATASTARASAHLARVLPGYDGYADARRRAELDRALRQALAARLLGARDALAAAQARQAAAGRFVVLPRFETLVGQVAHLADRFGRPAQPRGRWLGDKWLGEGARAALVALDRDLWARVEDLAAAAQGLSGGAGEDPGSVLDLVAEALRAAAERWELRLRALAAPAPPEAPAPRPLGGIEIGDGLRLLGETHRVTGTLRWARGDRAWLLDGPEAGLRLWLDQEGAPVLLERQALQIPEPPPEPIPLDGESFRRVWDDGGERWRREAEGLGREAAPRGVYRGDAGTWLWIESEPAGKRVWRGLALDPAALEVI